MRGPGPRRRLLSAAALAFVLGALPAGAVAQVPSGDSVSGSGGGSNSAGDAWGTSIDVSSGPSGESPTGEVFMSAYDHSDETYTWDWLTPTCLSVTGDTAIIGFTGRRDLVRDQVPGAILGSWPQAGLVKVVDGDPAGPDSVEWAVTRGSDGDADIPGPTTCDAFPGPFGESPLPPFNGGLDFTVVDGGPSCAGRPATVTGSGTVVGTPGDDVIVASDGDDVILGFGGNDVVCARAGADSVYAGAGNDAVLGGAGDDFIRGGPGDDLLVGDAGNDQLHGMSGNDLLLGAPGDDTLLGGAGTDTLHGNEDGDVLLGGPGPDRLDGGGAANSCYGGAGQDSLSNCTGPS